MTDEVDTIGKDVEPLPVFLYGRSDSDATQKVRERLQELKVPFVELNIKEDQSAAQLVERINDGERRTPTIVFGEEDFYLVQPSMAELDEALRKARYRVE